MVQPWKIYEVRGTSGENTHGKRYKIKARTWYVVQDRGEDVVGSTDFAPYPGTRYAVYCVALG